MNCWPKPMRWIPRSGSRKRRSDLAIEWECADRPSSQDNEDDMGEIRVKLKLMNLLDETRFRHGEIKKEDIRIYEADAMVDTGAVRSVIPVHVLQQLG